MNLSIDIETYSDVDLTKCGVYAYVDGFNLQFCCLHMPLTMKKQKLWT